MYHTHSYYVPPCSVNHKTGSCPSSSYERCTLINSQKLKHIHFTRLKYLGEGWQWVEQIGLYSTSNLSTVGAHSILTTQVAWCSLHVTCSGNHKLVYYPPMPSFSVSITMQLQFMAVSTQSKSQFYKNILKNIFHTNNTSCDVSVRFEPSSGQTWTTCTTQTALLTSCLNRVGSCSIVNANLATVLCSMWRHKGASDNAWWECIINHQGSFML